jgi:hypothetical protein
MRPKAVTEVMTGVRRWFGRGEPVETGGSERSETAVPDLSVMLRETLRRDLSLAAEHLESIRWLLEIAREHRQPVPAAALTNLQLVSKNLAELKREVARQSRDGAPDAERHVCTSSGD